MVDREKLPLLGLRDGSPPGLRSQGEKSIEVKRLGGGTALLTRSGQRLTLRVLAPAGVKLEIYETARPPAPYDHPNRGTRMIGFKVQLAASARQRLTVCLTPGTVKVNESEVRPFTDW